MEEEQRRALLDAATPQYDSAGRITNPGWEYVRDQQVNERRRQEHTFFWLAGLAGAGCLLGSGVVVWLVWSVWSIFASAIVKAG